MQPDDVRFEAIRCFRRHALWTPRVFLNPIRLGELRRFFHVYNQLFEQPISRQITAIGSPARERSSAS
jgi:hypothetical protein